MKKGVLYISVGLLLTGTGIWLYEKYGSKTGGGGSVFGIPGFGGNPNYDALLKNLGGNVKPDSNGVISVTFNGQNNRAQFYTNDRVVIFNAGIMGTAPQVVAKGSYSNGGLTISLDGKSPVSSSSVFANLLNSLKIK